MFNKAILCLVHHILLLLKLNISTHQNRIQTALILFALNEFNCLIRLVPHVWDEMFRMNGCAAASSCSKITLYVTFSWSVPASYLSKLYS